MTIGSFALYGFSLIVLLTITAWIVKRIAVVVAPSDYAYVLKTAPLTAWFGILVIFIYVMLAVLAPVFAPFSETSIVASEYEPWGAPYYLGTDSLGRDMLSRLIFAARNTVGIALCDDRCSPSCSAARWDFSPLLSAAGSTRSFPAPSTS